MASVSMIDVGDLDLLQQNVICSRYVFDVMWIPRPEVGIQTHTTLMRM